jgi:hypothetical protein
MVSANRVDWQPRPKVIVLYEPPPPIQWQWRVLWLFAAFAAGWFMGR